MEVATGRIALKFGCYCLSVYAFDIFMESGFR